MAVPISIKKNRHILDRGGIFHFVWIENDDLLFDLLPRENALCQIKERLMYINNLTLKSKSFT